MTDAAPLLNGCTERVVDEALFNDLCEYFEARSDVRDGSYGVPKANTEMSLLSRLNDCILESALRASAPPSAQPEPENEAAKVAREMIADPYIKEGTSRKVLAREVLRLQAELLSALRQRNDEGRLRQATERSGYVNSGELEASNVVLANESAMLRGLLSDLVDAVNGMHDMDEMDGQVYVEAERTLNVALDAATPFTEVALVSRKSSHPGRSE